MDAARNSNFPKNKKLKFRVPGLKRGTLAGQPGTPCTPPRRRRRRGAGHPGREISYIKYKFSGYEPDDSELWNS